MSRAELIKIRKKVRRRNFVIIYTSTLEACIINKKNLNCSFRNIFWPNWYYWNTETCWEDLIDWNIKINGYNLFRNNQICRRKEKGEAICQEVHCQSGDTHSQQRNYCPQILMDELILTAHKLGTECVCYLFRLKRQLLYILCWWEKLHFLEGLQSKLYTVFHAAGSSCS